MENEVCLLGEDHLLMSVWDYQFYESVPVGPDNKDILRCGVPIWDDRYRSRFRHRLSTKAAQPNSDDDLDACCRKSSRNHIGKSGQLTAKALYRELCQVTVDPYLLVKPFCFGVEGGVAAKVSQPFRVVVHPQCSLICDIHSHLSEAEVIGLLAGKWDSVDNVLYIQVPFPCFSSTLEDDLTGSTDVEMNPIAEYKAREYAAKEGLQIIGWYHSHPRFKPHPSLIDISNQLQYQSLMRESSSHLPFVGLIISSYANDTSEYLAQHQWFVAHPYEEETSSGTVHMPVAVDIETHSLTMVAAIDLDVSNVVKDTLNGLEREVIEVAGRSKEKIDEPAAEESMEVEKRPASRKFRAPKGAIIKQESQVSDVQSQQAANYSSESELAGQKAQIAISSDESASPTRKSSRLVNKPSIAMILRLEDEKLFPSKKRRKKDLSKESSLEQIEPVQLVTIDKPKATVEEKIIPTIYNSIILAINEPILKSSALARQLLSISPPELRCAATIIVGLGLFYSRFKRRVDLKANWRGIPKLEKLKRSANSWIEFFQTSSPYFDVPGTSVFMDAIVEFLSECWTDYSQATGKLRKVARKQEEASEDGSSTRKAPIAENSKSRSKAVSKSKITIPTNTKTDATTKVTTAKKPRAK